MGDDWLEVKLNDISEIIMGQSPPSSTYNENGVGFPFFQGKAEFTDLHPIVSKWCSSPKKIAESQDILISVRAPVGATNIADRTCCIGRGLAAIRYSSCNKYVFYFLKSIETELDKKGTGTTFKAISGKILKSEIIPFPPLPEQRAIVSKIEQLFSELDNGIANFRQAREQLKVYRQAVLKKAFEGELTRQWRARQDDLPDAKDLLEQIRVEREESYNRKLDEWKEAVKEWEDGGKEGKKPGRPKKSKGLKQVVERELNELYELPAKWEWSQISELAESMKNGIYKSKSFYKEKGTACLRMYNIVNGKIEWFDIKRMELDVNEMKEYGLVAGDLLVNRVNSRELVGKTAIIPEAMEFSVYESKNIRLRLVPKMNSKLVNYWFLLYANMYFNNNAQQTVGMASINQDQLGNFNYPLCSLPEQKAIVTEIETRLSVCDKLEQDIEENLERARALRHSILKRAFEGKLLNKKELAETRNSPDWEPAEVLLERIRAGKVKA